MVPESKPISSVNQLPAPLLAYHRLTISMTADPSSRGDMKHICVGILMNGVVRQRGWWERAVGVAGERLVNVRGGMSAHWPHYLN